MKEVKIQDAPVKVMIADIKLSLGDLAFLKELSAGKGIVCWPNRKTADKLTFLGLIERGNIPACPREIAAWEAKKAESLVKIRRALEQDDVDMSVIHSASYIGVKPAGQRDGWNITTDGKKLLKEGIVSVKTTKPVKGCL